MKIAAYTVGNIDVASSRLRSFYLFSLAKDFGLDKTNVQVEYIPISVTKQYDQELVEDYEDYSRSESIRLTRGE